MSITCKILAFLTNYQNFIVFYFQFWDVYKLSILLRFTKKKSKF